MKNKGFHWPIATVCLVLGLSVFFPYPWGSAEENSPSRSLAGTGLSQSETDAFISLAKRQTEIFEARIESDWRVIYAMLPPDFRKHNTLADFIKGRVVSPPSAPQGGRNEKISGARTRTPDKKEILEKLLKRRVSPRTLRYRLLDFSLSENGNDAMVTVDTFMTLGMMGPVYGRGTISEYWKKVDGEWYFDIKLRFAIRASGAKTDNFPKYTVHANARKLAHEFFATAKELPPGEQRNNALENAFLLDTLEIAPLAVSEKIGADEMAISHMDRMMRPIKLGPIYPMAFFEMGRRYESVKDFAAAMAAYKTALSRDMNYDPAHIRAVEIALKMGKWNEAADHYMHLLRLSVMLNKKYTVTLEPHLYPECTVCGRLEAAQKIKLAGALVQAQKWDMAVSIYKTMIVDRKQWPEIIKDLERGESLTPIELLGDELGIHARGLTYHEVSELLKREGIALYHPGDRPENQKEVGRSISASSAPYFVINRYGIGVHATDVSVNNSSIAWENGGLSFDANLQGGVAALIKGDEIKGLEFNQDPSPLVEKIGAMEKDEAIIISGTLLQNSMGDENLMDALSSIGVSPNQIGGPSASYIIYGYKDAQPGNALVWTNYWTIRKTFLPSNMKGVGKEKGPAIVISGRSEKDTVRLISGN